MGRVKPKRQGILAVGNYDSNVGYAWRLMERFWCELSLLGREADFQTYVCFPSVSEVPECLREAHCETAELDFTRSDFAGVLKQLRFITRHSIRVVYLTDFKTFSFRYALFRLAGVRKIIVHDHTPGVRQEPVGLKKRIKRIANRMPLLSCSAAFAVSPYIERRLITVNGVPESRVFCITNGIDMVGPVPERVEREPGSSIRIVTVGRVCYYKGIDFALKVLARLASDPAVPAFEYQVIGDGPDRRTFEVMANDLGLQDRVTFTGNVGDVPERLAQCDIAFHPSKGEAMSLAILEYMRAGLAICVSDNPSVSSALRADEDALIYREGDQESAFAGLRKLLERKKLRLRLGTEAQSRVTKQYRSQLMLTRFRASIEEVMCFQSVNPRIEE